MGLCVTLVVGMVSAVNLAIPSLSRSALQPSAAAVLWVVDGYVAVFACLLVPAGALADRLGRKGVLLAGTAVFAAGCLLAGTATDVGVLIAGRMVSGVGAAAVLPTTLALMVAGTPPAGRAGRIAVWAAMTGLAAVLGNVGGGAAIQAGSWRALFLAAVPLSLVALALAAAAAPKTPRYARPVAPLGVLLLTCSFFVLLFALVSGPQQGWTSRTVLGSFAAAAAALTWWVRRELRSAHPLLDPRLLASPPVRAGALGMTVVFTGMFGLFYLNGQYLQYAKGYSPSAPESGCCPWPSPCCWPRGARSACADASASGASWGWACSCWPRASAPSPWSARGPRIPSTPSAPYSPPRAAGWPRRSSRTP